MLFWRSRDPRFWQERPGVADPDIVHGQAILGVAERIEVESVAQEPVDLVVHLAVGADLADLLLDRLRWPRQERQRIVPGGEWRVDAAAAVVRQRSVDVEVLTQA